MSLAPGVRLGPYEIIAAIGAGGMGEVYRARDTKLDRDVAIKVLPDAFAADPERIARFQREAKMLAALNHPHIAAIYGLEEAVGVKALVLELVEGPTLADRIAQGPLPIDEALAIAKQIADALETAHEQGIIHRDLKPANIKLRPDGAVKVLDFGLAKALAADPSGASNVGLTNSPTITSPIAMSGVGVLLGTAAYMAPEQARGKVVDKRADIWAFGCVFYEMLTGQAPFAGSDVSEVLAGVIKSDPGWEQLPTDLPPALRKVLQQCLHKDPKQRLRDIGDVRLALDGAFETGTRGSSQAPVIVQRIRLWQLPGPVAAAVALLVAASGVGVWYVASESIEPARVRRMTLNSSAAASYAGQGVAISADGMRVVFTGTYDAGLFVRRLDQLEAQRLPGTEFSRQPFFSPDGESIAFFSDRGGGAAQMRLFRMSLQGGTPQPLCAAPFARGGSWSADGTIIFASGSAAYQGRLLRVSENGGTAEPLRAPPENQVARSWPQVLPGGNHVLYTASVGNAPHLELLSLDTGESRTIVENAQFGRYISTGHLMYMSDVRLMAVPFDLERLATTGSASIALQGVRTINPLGISSVAIAEDGTLIYQPGVADRQGLQGGDVVVVSRDGRATKVDATRGADIWPRLSPDESQVAVFSIDASAPANLNADVWVYDLRRGTRDKVTTEPTEESYQMWTPDGLRMVFLSNRSGAGDLYWQAMDRSGSAELLVKGAFRKVANAFSPNGTVLAFYEVNDRTLRDIWMLPIGGKPEPFIATPADEVAPSFSPDGKWVAYVSDESGEREIYVQPYPGPGRRIPISTGGGEAPRWSRDGRELFYFRAQPRQSGQLMVVDVSGGPASAAAPQMVFEGPFLPQTNGNPNYDVFRDGKRFVMIQRRNESAAPEAPLVVVLNWFEELKRLVPAN